jgi:hypothetical protein
LTHRRQLRSYAIRDGELSEFIDEWRRVIVPLRKAHGFVVEGAWVDELGSAFTWVLQLEGHEDFEEAERRYLAAKTAALDGQPDPATRVTDAKIRTVTSIDPGDLRAS